MAWSIFSQGPAAAVQWAHDLLASIGAPQSPGNVQFVYDWERSEGGGGANNPLNQGPVPGHPELTTTGSQYGGGAADFATRDAGLAGAADYLAMGNFAGIASALKADNAGAARSALIASPWAASHYNGGANFSHDAIPGGTDTLAGVAAGSPSSTSSSASSGTLQIGPWNTGIPDAAGLAHYSLLALGAVAGMILIIIGAQRATDSHPAAGATKLAAAAAL